MLTKNIKIAVIAGAAALMGTSAMAQTAATGAATTEVQQPGATVVVPAEATTPSAPVGTIVAGEWPSFNPEQLANDQTIAETLLAQGFTGVHILRDGSLMTVSANRDGNDIELVYNLVEGRLISVNGERILSEDEAAPTRGNSTPETAPDGGTDDGADDGDGSDDGADDSAGDDGADDGADDGGSDEGGSDDSSNG